MAIQVLKGEIKETRYSLAPSGGIDDGSDRGLTLGLDSGGASDKIAAAAAAAPGIEARANTASSTGGGGAVSSISGSELEARGRGGEAGSLVKTSTVTCNPGTVTYIEDSMGLHKMENPSPTEECISLHLYSPGISECTTWADASACARCGLLIL